MDVTEVPNNPRKKKSSPQNNKPSDQEAMVTGSSSFKMNQAVLNFRHLVLVPFADGLNEIGHAETAALVFSSLTTNPNPVVRLKTQTSQVILRPHFFPAMLTITSSVRLTIHRAFQVRATKAIWKCFAKSLIA